MIIEYKIKNSNISINQILEEELKISSRLRYKLIKLKKIFLNDISIDTRNFPKTSDILKIDFDYEEDSSNIIPTKIDLDIIYEDDSFLAINKPAGISTHPSRAHFTDSLSNGVKFYFDSIGLKKKIRPVNRLDIDTSGIVIFAKNEYIQEFFIREMANNTFHKEYIAICDGFFSIKKGRIDKPISRKENSIIERTISINGKPSITDYEVLKEFNNYSLVKFNLLTGRTHQIRVHMKSIFHPISGDTLYGVKCNFIDRQALHCYNISFIHPLSKQTISLKCLPKENFFKNFISLCQM